MKERAFTEKSLLKSRHDDLETVNDFYLSKLPNVLKQIYPKIIDKKPLKPEDTAEDIYIILNFIKAISISNNSNFDYLSAYHDFFSNLETSNEAYSNDPYYFRSFCLKQNNKRKYTYKPSDKEE